MKLKQSIQYQLADFIGPVIVYYGVVVALHVVACLAWIFSSIRIYMGGGLSAFSTVFLFICGLCSFHDNLPMHLQNGVSRKTMYTAWLAVTGIVSAAMAVADTVLAVLIDLLDLPIWGYAPPICFSPCLTWTTCLWANPCQHPVLHSLQLCTAGAGHDPGLFYCGVPLPPALEAADCSGSLRRFVLFFGVPGVKIIDTNLLGEGLRAFFYQYVEPVLAFIWQNPVVLMGTWAGAAVILAAVTWLILRRTTVLR